MLTSQSYHVLMIENIAQVVLMQSQNTQNRTAVKRRFNIRLVPTRIDVFILENIAPTEGVGETSPFTL